MKRWFQFSDFIISVLPFNVKESLLAKNIPMINTNKLGIRKAHLGPKVLA